MMIMIIIIIIIIDQAKHYEIMSSRNVKEVNIVEIFFIS